MFVINIFYIPLWTQMNINIKNIKRWIDWTIWKIKSVGLSKTSIQGSGNKKEHADLIWFSLFR